MRCFRLLHQKFQLLPGSYTCKDVDGAFWVAGLASCPFEGQGHPVLGKERPAMLYCGSVLQGQLKMRRQVAGTAGVGVAEGRGT